MKYNHAPLRFNCKGFIMPMVEEKTPPEDVVAPTYNKVGLYDENFGSTALESTPLKAVLPDLIPFEFVEKTMMEIWREDLFIDEDINND